MKKNNPMKRRRFLAGAGLAAAGATVVATAQAETGNGSSFTPQRHAEDSWMDELGVSHRAFVDSSTGQGGIAAVNFASNILRAHAMGYGGSDDDYGMIVCFRHASAPFGFNDAMWEKYSEVFVGRTQIHDSNGDPVTHNPLSMERTYGNRDNTLTNLANRGIHFAICNLSTLGMAGMIARAAGRQSDEVYQELVANAVPNSQFVAAGVLGATRAQEYGYTFMYASDAD